MQVNRPRAVDLQHHGPPINLEYLFLWLDTCRVMFVGVVHSALLHACAVHKKTLQETPDMLEEIRRRPASRGTERGARWAHEAVVVHVARPNNTVVLHCR
ncbi:unnamed protein product [Prorocentrum cordatum]|uniref:Uncharacterized protein n=1 Tax=Prorocentrum cordatum TaxID=2364126 RepID=A0ABN9VRX9_9DINO|nr:unnamed protein product [Polarella glacialis]